MKICKSIIRITVFLVLLLTLTVSAYATVSADATGIGIIEIKAEVPDDFVYPLSVYLDHENGASQIINLEAYQNYQVTKEVESGKYLVCVSGALDANGNNPLPSNIMIRHSTVFVVVRDRANPFELTVTNKNQKDTVDNPVNNTEQEIEQIFEEAPQTSATIDASGEESTASEEPATSTSIQEDNIAEALNSEAINNGEEETTGEKKAFSRFFKRNIVSFILLIILCVGTAIIKIKNEL